MDAVIPDGAADVERSGFTLRLCSATQRQRIENVTSFVGEDASGQFGVLAGHARMTTVLNTGLARYCVDGHWTYLALPGAVLHFRHNELHVTARRYLCGRDPEHLSETLAEQLRAEDERLHDFKENLGKLEQEMMRRIWQMERA